ncbi:RNA recognition motif domain-containing protein [Iningainema tapete]|uniref:RNA-binding protein n=1 Tax=Iningainema tapete BLCC-T55 TaxID=2748662 RepID=A0A8J6XT47_9CYAN|nr:RNA-binding protein [Iningainema tapete]MBD2777051.1 RNA-binding protein [Iningainema tapete BLCC-T55]
MSVYVSNLSNEVKELDLKQIFSEYGSVKRVRLPIDKKTGEKRGFAFVEMETDAEEAAAIQALLGTEWMGRSLKVNKAITRLDTSSSS